MECTACCNKLFLFEVVNKVQLTPSSFQISIFFFYWFMFACIIIPIINYDYDTIGYIIIPASTMLLDMLSTTRSMK